MCIRFLLSWGAFWIFSLIGWITMAPEKSLFWSVIWISLVVFLFDLLLLAIQAFAQTLSLPLSCLTGGIFSFAIAGLFKYFSLVFTASATSLFTLPWIFSGLWWQALIIGLVFAFIGSIGQPTVKGKTVIIRRSE